MLTTTVRIAARADDRRGGEGAVQIIELVRTDLLQADDVGREVADRREAGFAPASPLI